MRTAQTNTIKRRKPMLSNEKLRELITLLDNVFEDYKAEADADPIEIASVYLASALSKMRSNLNDDQLEEFKDEMALLMEKFTLDRQDFVGWLQDATVEEIELAEMPIDPTIH